MLLTVMTDTRLTTGAGLSRTEAGVHELAASAYLNKMNERHEQGIQAGWLVSSGVGTEVKIRIK